MSYTQHLEQQLQQVDKQIARAEKKLETGDVATKAQALGELSKLRSRHDDLVARIEDAKSKDADHWSGIRESLREDADALGDAVSSWMNRFG